MSSKKFKFHWGWAILTVILTYVAVFTYLFVKSFDELKSNEEVVKNYYEAELQYGKVLNKREHADTMRIPLKITQKENLNIVFPPYWDKNKISGTVTLYRPNKKALDQHLPIKLDSTNTMIIPANKLLLGSWTVQVDWKVDSIPFYKEKAIYWGK